MDILTVRQKTGFYRLNLKEPVILNDFRGFEFYNTSRLKKPVKQFNLPEGSYTIVSGKFKPMSTPVNFPLPALPKPQRNLKKPMDFDVIFANNPFKCTVNWDDKTITFDNDFKRKPLNELYFILYHEFGHHAFKSEHLADLYSARVMLNKGFNPSQIGLAPINSLSEKQLIRKKHIVTKILQK
jgi:hypothetical protein